MTAESSPSFAPQPEFNPKLEAETQGDVGYIVVERYSDLTHPPCAQDGLKRWIFIPMFDFQKQRRKDVPFPPLPSGIRHPSAEMNLAEPHARGSPLGDVSGYAWGGLLGDFVYINLVTEEMARPGVQVGPMPGDSAELTPVETSIPFDSVGFAMATRSQLRALGIWTFIDLDSFHLRPRIRRPWPVIGIQSMEGILLLNLPDNGALESQPDNRLFLRFGRNNIYQGSPARRFQEFTKTSYAHQLWMKQESDWPARVADCTQPEYAIEQAQQKYEREYHTTRLVVPVRYGRSKHTQQARAGIFVVEGDKMRVRGQILPNQGKLSYVYSWDLNGKPISTTLDLDIRIGKARRERIPGQKSLSTSLLDALDYSKSPIIWLYTCFLRCDCRPAAEVTLSDRVRIFGLTPPPQIVDSVSKLDYPILPPFEEIPILQEGLPYEHLPDILLVDDQDGITSLQTENSISLRPPSDSNASANSNAPANSDVPAKADTSPDASTSAHAAALSKAPAPPVRYVRLRPRLAGYNNAGERGERVPAVARLILDSSHLLGTGHHSMVHDAALQLPLPLVTHEGNRFVRVAAKTCFLSPEKYEARELFLNEAKVYDRMPRHLTDDYTGYVKVYPIREPVPVQAVVPKFYGYYAPMKEEEGEDGTMTEVVDESKSGILLLENCGTPINLEELNGDDIREVYSLLLRLHQADCIQGSFYGRNVVRQPGPLNVGPEERSLETPSFRVIDFGRGQHFRDYLEADGKGKSKKVAIDEFKRMKHEEQMAALDRSGFIERDLVHWMKVCPV